MRLLATSRRFRAVQRRCGRHLSAGHGDPRRDDAMHPDTKFTWKVSFIAGIMLCFLYVGYPFYNSMKPYWEAQRMEAKAKAARGE